MHALLLAALLGRSVLVGTWVGDSICTGVRPACHDEHVVYHISIPDQQDRVTILMNKIVDGKEEEMGTLEFTVDPAAKTLTSEFEKNGLRCLWSFKRSGSRMRGTLTMPPHGAVIRNIRVVKR